MIDLGHQLPASTTEQIRIYGIGITYYVHSIGMIANALWLGLLDELPHKRSTLLKTSVSSAYIYIHIIIMWSPESMSRVE